MFSVTNTKPGLVPPNEQVSVAWTQADYLRIAAALHQYVWGEPLTDWNISKIDFALGCTEVGVGLQNGRIEFFKNVKTRERESRITHFVDIDPRSNFVYISESEYYPKLVDWTPIDLTKIKIPADEALQISERSGGSEKRKVIGNACNISLIFSPSSANGYGWQIGYSKDGEAGYIFELQINPFTGAYK